MPFRDGVVYLAILVAGFDLYGSKGSPFLKRHPRIILLPLATVSGLDAGNH